MILFSAVHIFLFKGFLKLFHEHFVPERALDYAVKEKAIVHETLTVRATWLAIQIIIVLSKILFSKILTLPMFRCVEIIIAKHSLEKPRDFGVRMMIAALSEFRFSKKKKTKIEGNLIPIFQKVSHPVCILICNLRKCTPETPCSHGEGVCEYDSDCDSSILPHVCEYDCLDR